jgi:hypothetical protein
MAGVAITKKDTRLLLFQALERLAPEGFSLEKMKKDAAGMSYQYAKRFYTVVFKNYLVLASSCVLGIINLGLTILSKNDVKSAAEIIKQKNFLTLFKVGWAEIDKLAKQKAENKLRGNDSSTLNETLHETQKELGILVSADMQSPWQALEKLNNISQEVQEKFDEFLLKDFLVNKYAPEHLNGQISQGIGAQSIDKKTDECVKNANAIDTLFASLLIAPKPFLLLKSEHIIKLCQKVRNKIAIKKLKLDLLALPVPPALAKAHQKIVNEFMANFVRECNCKESEVGLLEYLFFNLIIMPDLDGFSKLRYKITKSLSANIEPKFLLSGIRENADMSDKMAMLDSVLEHHNKLDAGDLLEFIHLLLEAGMKWQGKIKWHILPKDELRDLCVSSAGKKIIKDIFDQKMEKKLLAYWKNLPDENLLELMRQSKRFRDYIFKRHKRAKEIYRDSCRK